MFAFWLTACTPVSILEPAAPRSLDKLTAVVLPYTSSGPLFIAQEEGYFAQQNLEVEFVPMDSGSGPLPALEQGSLDVAASGPTAGLLNAIGRGGQLRIVADKGNMYPSGCTYMALLAAPAWIESDPLTHPDQLKGAQVSIDPTNFEAFMFERVLAEAGLTLDDVTIEDIAPPALAEAAKNGAVDLISVGDPWITRLLDTGQVAIWRPAEQMAPHLQFGVILFGKNLLEDDSGKGVRFMAAYLQGVRQYNQGKTDRNVEIMAKYTKLESDLLRRACWPTMQPDGMVNMDSVMAFQSWAVGKGLVDQRVDAAQIWDDRFVTKAQQQLESAQ